MENKSKGQVSLEFQKCSKTCYIYIYRKFFQSESSDFNYKDQDTVYNIVNN